MRAKKLVLGGLMVVVLMGLVGCGSDSKKAEVLGSQRKAADLVVSDTYPFYEPASLTIALNKEVTLRVFNAGKVVHNVTIPDMQIDVDVPAGQSADIKLPALAAAPRAGFLLIYSKYGQYNGESGHINIAK